jgi:hypothetical protein
LKARYGPLRPSLVSFSRSETCPAAYDEPLPAAIGFYALGEATEGLAEMLTSAGFGRACPSVACYSIRCCRRAICSLSSSISCSRYFSRPRMRVYPDSRTDPRPSTAWTTVLPKKRAETSSPPSTDWRADRAVVVLAKAPTAKPPTAPTVAPTTNLVVPWPKSNFLPALPSFDGASLAQRPCCKVILGCA